MNNGVDSIYCHMDHKCCGEIFFLREQIKEYKIQVSLLKEEIVSMDNEDKEIERLKSILIESGHKLLFGRHYE